MAEAGDGFEAINLGTGIGTTVLELVHAFGEVTGEELAVEVAPPRAGDLIGSVPLVGKAAQLLGWRAELGVHAGIRDALRWRQQLSAILRQNST